MRLSKDASWEAGLHQDEGPRPSEDGRGNLNVDRESWIELSILRQSRPFCE